MPTIFATCSNMSSKSATTLGWNLTVQASRATCGASALVISQSLPLIDPGIETVPANQLDRLGARHRPAASSVR